MQTAAVTTRSSRRSGHHKPPPKHSMTMPGIIFTRTMSTPELKAMDSPGAEEATERRKPRTFMDIKAYLKSMLPHLEPGLRPSASKIHKFHEEEAVQWSKSLERLLASHIGRAAFRVFLKSEYSDENIEFWLACEEYKKATSAESLQHQAQSIYQEFIHAEAERQVNLDFQTRESVAQKVRGATLTCFDEAQRTVYMLMERDSYPRFLKSNAYLNLVNKSQGSRG